MQHKRHFASKVRENEGNKENKTERERATERERVGGWERGLKVLNYQNLIDWYLGCKSSV